MRVDETLIVSGVDISHARLVELTRLADQAKPFYDWVESRFRSYFSSKQTLDEILRTASKDKLREAILDCYSAAGKPNLPLLFDGTGRRYSHVKACYYMFSWLIRDAPRQRLEPLIQRIVRDSGKSRIDAEAEVLSSLIDRYRENVGTFAWQAVREVIIDRLEGSRRSIKGHEKEAIVRSAFLIAFQSFFGQNNSYGRYAGVELSDKEVVIGGETFDVTVNLLDIQGKRVRRILTPIKTRETEGGGHSHLFTRDIKAAMKAVKSGNPKDFLVAVIVARNWAEREKEDIRKLVDHAAIFDISPNEFTEFSNEEQERLNDFIASLLTDKISPKPPITE